MNEHEQNDWITRLNTLGLEVEVSPLAVTMTYAGLCATGATFEEALSRFLAKSLKELDSLRAWKRYMRPIVNEWSRKH